jgi:hypothetical protein
MRVKGTTRAFQGAWAALCVPYDATATPKLMTPMMYIVSVFFCSTPWRSAQGGAK